MGSEDNENRTAGVMRDVRDVTEEFRDIIENENAGDLGLDRLVEGEIGERDQIFTPSRDRGLFTEDDRRYLLGEKEYSHVNTELNTRRRIRDRVKDSLLDLAYLDLMNPEDVRKVINDGIPASARHLALSGIVAFAFGAVGSNIGHFEEILESGIFRADSLSADDQVTKDVDVNINISREPSMDRILEKHKSDINLTNSEIGLLLRSGDVEVAELEQYVTD